MSRGDKGRDGTVRMFELRHDALAVATSIERGEWVAIMKREFDKAARQFARDITTALGV